jgi:aspartyl-tRNA(Asn)/glutamyl-tRNA(Gln) amidotransferase subunit A
MAGRDWQDPYSRDLPAVPVRPFVRIARLSEKSTGDVDPGVQHRIDDAMGVLSQLGGQARDVDIEGFVEVRHSAARMIQIEAWSRYGDDLSRTPEKFSPETQDRLRLGSTGTGEEYVRADWRIQQWRRDIQRLLSHEIDLLVLPCVPEIAPVAGTAHMVEATARMTSFTLPISAAHVPAVSVPCGTSEGMPVGVQLVAAPGRDLELLALAERFQALLPPEWPAPA